MTAFGDRDIAGLLSALAEAPDFPAAASFLLAELAELSGASKACLLRLEPSLENLTPVAALGLGTERPDVSVSASDLSSPLVITTFALSPIGGRGSLGPRALDGFESWLALPMPQPGFRGAPESMPRFRAVELAIARRVTLLPAEVRVGAVPFGVVVLERPNDDAVDSADRKSVV